MDYKQKYLKYKSKYISLKKGGFKLLSSDKMPQLCFGTAQINLEITLSKALANGYRHIDGAEAYGDYRYKTTVRDAIKSIPRDELWITWKDNDISLEKIRRICTELNCEYINLFLVHHSCGKESDFFEFKKAQDAGLIRYYGVSNCENLDTIRSLKEKYNIFANQIQARPPNGRVSGRELFSPPNFIEECNKIGVNTMLFATLSGILNLSEYSSVYSYLEGNLINKYYIQKYILESNNVLIISSLSGSTLERNINDFNNFITNKEELSAGLMAEIENNLETIILNYQ
jgi:diketogulonate reductase-like aldo/keto reductase